MVANIQPFSEEERVVAVTGRTVFEQANDLVSRLRSVEIAAKYRLVLDEPVWRTDPVPCFIARRCWKWVDLTRVGTMLRTWKSASAFIQAGGTIVYARDALVKHVPETGAAHFLAKRKRDARAHMRILRHHPEA